MKNGSLNSPARTWFGERALAIVAVLLTAILVLAACRSDADVEGALVGVGGIIDPANLGWPRDVTGLNGPVTILEKPERIVTISLGHDEVTYALVPRNRVVATNIYTQSPEQSNVAHLAAGLPEITSDAEVIVAQSPDIVIASPFTSLELIKALENVGMVVLQTNLHNDADGRHQDIMLLGYAYGEEERALEVVEEVEKREASLRSIWESKPEVERIRVLSATLYGDSLYTAGAGSTEGEIINIAGGINVAAEAGLENNPIISYESLIAMDPEVIFIPQPVEFGGEEFRDAMLANPILASVAAIRDGRVFMADPKYFTTLSFWNLRGAEELARNLWPEELADTTFGPFSFPSE